MRDGKLSLNAEITSALLSMIDLNRQLFASLESTGQEGELDCSAVIESLSAILAAQEEAGGEADPSRHPHCGNAPPPLLGEVLVEQGAVGAGRHRQALNSQQEGDPRRIGEILVHNGAVPPNAVQEALQVQAESREETVNSNIRVDVNLLDKVMNLVGELVLARNQILQFTSNQKDAGVLEHGAALEPDHHRVAGRRHEDAHAAHRKRLEQISPHRARSVQLRPANPVRLEMEGAQTELDKTIIEAIKDPLTHIVRNSLDHGIETPAEREAAGKPGRECSACAPSTKAGRSISRSPMTAADSIWRQSGQGYRARDSIPAARRANV